MHRKSSDKLRKAGCITSKFRSLLNTRPIRLRKASVYRIPSQFSLTCLRRGFTDDSAGDLFDIACSCVPICLDGIPALADCGAAVRDHCRRGALLRLVSCPQHALGRVGWNWARRRSHPLHLGSPQFASAVEPPSKTAHPVRTDHDFDKDNCASKREIPGLCWHSERRYRSNQQLSLMPVTPAM